MRNTAIFRLALVYLAACLAGCASTNLLHFSKNEFPRSGPKNPVVRIVGLWQAAEGIEVNNSSRGFSGQILFFANEGSQPVQVDGEVRFYVFDDQGTEEEQVKPLHQYDYPAESWNALLGKGPLGATYSVFVPYPRPGFHQANCMLRVRYTPKQGPTIYSEMISIVLQGTKPKTTAQREKEQAPTNVLSAAGGTPKGAGLEPPYVQGVAEAIPVTPPRESARPRVAELTDEDRQRLIEAAKARLAAEKHRKVELAAHEEPAPVKPGTETGWKPRQPNILEADDSASSPISAENEDSGQFRKNSSTRHILDDDNAGTEDEFLNQPARSSEEGVD